MDDTPNTPPPINRDDSLRVLAYVVYGSFVLGPVIPLVPLIGIIVAAIKVKDAEGTIYHSHFVWILRTFAIAFAAGLVGALLLVIPIIEYLGMLFLGLLSLWVLWRLVKGALKLIDNKPVEDVTAWY